MNVGDLIEILELMDPTATVILSSDPEGNSYAPLEDYAEGFYDSKYSEFHRPEDVVDTTGEDFEENDVPGKQETNAVAFWPAF